MHESFKTQLEKLSPKEEVLNLVKIIANDTWDKKIKEINVVTKNISSNLEKNQKSTDSYLERISKATNEDLITVYEDKIKSLASDKTDLLKQKRNIEENNKDFGTALDLILKNIKNPCKTWSEGELEDRKNVFNLTYSSPIIYSWESGFETAQISPVFKLIETISNSNSEYVEMAGIEPASVIRF